jgi:purine-binding chemotaxis protein CheW
VADSGVICVEVAGSAYGIAVADVQEVVGYRPLTRVFHAPRALAGVTNLRGEVLPVIDLASLLHGDQEARAEPAEPRVVVVRERAGAKRRVGLKVDALLGLREVPASGCIDAPPAVQARLGDLLVGVVSEPSPAFALLSIEGILNAPAFREVSGAAIE